MSGIGWAVIVVLIVAGGYYLSTHLEFKDKE